MIFIMKRKQIKMKYEIQNKEVIIFGNIHMLNRVGVLIVILKVIPDTDKYIFKDLTIKLYMKDSLSMHSFRQSDFK